jgi:tetratricopeptide (TPR) repeat protein
VGIASIVILSFLLYVPSLQHGFVHWDDHDYIVENTHVQQGLTWESMRWALTTTSASNWHPLTWLSHELDWDLFGMHPAGYHAINIMLHAFNAALLFYLLQAATGRWRCSWLVAALWAVHPLAVESVSWVSERKNVLSMFLFLLTLLAYGRYVLRPSVRGYLGVACLFALALAAKPAAITLPAALLLIDYWPLNRIASWGPPQGAGEPAQITLTRAVAEKIPLLLLSVGSGVVTVVAQRLGGALQSFDQYPLRVRLENATLAYVSYLKLMIWPAKLAALYPHPGTSLLWTTVCFSLLFLGVVTWLVWRGRRSKPYLLVGWLWYLGTLIPMIGIVQVGVQSIADRYTYLPSIGLLVATVWLGFDLADQLRLSSGPRIAAVSLILLALAVATWRQQDSWADDYRLWSHALEVTDDNYVAESNFSAELVSRGQLNEALPHLQKAVRLNPRDGASHLDIGGIMLSQGQVGPAIRELTLASKLPADRKKKFAAYLNLAIAFVGSNEASMARENFHRARDTDSDSFEQLIVGYRSRTQQRPSADSYFWLAILEGQAGRRDEAHAAWLKALAIKPEYSSKLDFFEKVIGS